MKTLYEEYCEGINNRDPIKYKLFHLIFNLTDRRGFRQMWDECDSDTKNEILESWFNIIK
jgi:hypothetical protein